MNRSSSRLRLLTFDATNTFLFFRRPIGVQYADVAESYGIVVDPARVEEKFRACYMEVDRRYPNFGQGSAKRTWQSWWVDVVKRTLIQSGVSTSDKRLSELSYHLIKLYSTGDPWCVLDGMPSILEQVRDSGVTLGCISNFDPRLSGILENLGLRHYFNFVLTSYELGVAKPEKAVFDAALDRSGLSGILPQDALHVGDNVEKDYHGARAAGWHALVLLRQIVRNPEVGIAVDPEHLVVNVEELKAKLLNWTNL